MNIKVKISRINRSPNESPKTSWFNVPIAWEEVQKQLHLSGAHDEYVIVDYQAPFPISANSSLAQINHWFHLYQSITDPAIRRALPTLIRQWFQNFEDLATHSYRIKVHRQLDYEELIYGLLQTGQLYGHIHPQIAAYLDIHALATDLLRQKVFYIGDGVIFEYRA